MILEHVHNIILCGQKAEYKTTDAIWPWSCFKIQVKYMQKKKSERKHSESNAHSGYL